MRDPDANPGALIKVEATAAEQLAQELEKKKIEMEHK